jgi:hypothetical protein
MRAGDRTSGRAKKVRRLQYGAILLEIQFLDSDKFESRCSLDSDKFESRWVQIHLNHDFQMDSDQYKNATQSKTPCTRLQALVRNDFSFSPNVTSTLVRYNRLRSVYEKFCQPPGLAQGLERQSLNLKRQQPCLSQATPASQRTPRAQPEHSHQPQAPTPASQRTPRTQPEHSQRLR